MDDLIEKILADIEIHSTDGWSSSSTIEDVIAKHLSGKVILDANQVTLEKIAREICKADGVEPDAIVHHRPDKYYWEEYTDHAKSVSLLYKGKTK